MRYFKLIENNIIVGAVTSNDFMRYMPITDCFIRANEQIGEYATFNGVFYRDTWMHPIVKTVPFTAVLIIEINEEEYNSYIDAFASNDIIINDDTTDEPDEPQEPYVDPIDQISLEFIRSSKLNEMSYTCRKTIENGFDLDIRGETQHFSLTTQDQLNLMNLNVMAQTQELIPYHADGETCIFYTPEEINAIIAAATSFKNYQLAYYNALKAYINSRETIEDISAITYGTPIPEEYKSDVLMVLE